MLRSLFVLSTAFVIGLPAARADIWGDIGHAIEHGVSGLGKAGADVITLGEEGRRRDREAANQAKKRAEDQKRAAELLRTERIHRLESELAHLNEMKIILTGYRNTLSSLKVRFGSSMQMTQQLAEIISQKALDDRALQTLIEIQRKDISEWVSVLDMQIQDSSNRQDEESSVAVLVLREKIIQYFDQIKNLPYGTEGDGGVALDTILDMGFETLQTIDTSLDALNERLSKNAAGIQDKEQQLKEI